MFKKLLRKLGLKPAEASLIDKVVVSVVDQAADEIVPNTKKIIKRRSKKL